MRDVVPADMYALLYWMVRSAPGQRIEVPCREIAGARFHIKLQMIERDGAPLLVASLEQENNLPS